MAPLRHFLYGFLISTFPLFASQQGLSIYSSLKAHGYWEIANYTCPKKEYCELYAAFDSFIARVSQDKSLQKELAQEEQRFLGNSDLKTRYCSAPPSYRDPALHQRKRHNKIYFQFIKEHYEQIKESGVVENAVVRAFLSRMARIDTLARATFGDLVRQLEPYCPGLKESLSSDSGDLAIVTKIVRYKRSNVKWGTTPHFDKSTLTLIWDSDDPAHDSLILCEDPAAWSLKKLKKPDRKCGLDGKKTSALLIGGLALSNLDIGIKPTLHAVRRSPNEYRHAVISFALPPNTDMSDWQTDFVEGVCSFRPQRSS